MFMRVNSKCAHQVRPPLPLDPRRSVNPWRLLRSNSFGALRPPSAAGFLCGSPAPVLLEAEGRPWRPAGVALQHRLWDLTS
jgi:hypothetical protein